MCILSENELLSPCRYEYHWADGTNIKKPIKCSAPKYIDYLMTWVQDQLDDETLFPSKIGLFEFPFVMNRYTVKAFHTGSFVCHLHHCLFRPGVPFPKNFMSVAKTILKRLFRVYAHIYHQHFDSVMQLQEEAHLNTSFKHFIFFVQVSALTHKHRSWVTISNIFVQLLTFLNVLFRSSISSIAESWRPCRTLSRNSAARIDRRWYE